MGRTAASFMVSALLGSPRGEAFVPCVALREIIMVSTMVPSHGRATITTPTSGFSRTSRTGTARVVNISDDHQKEPATVPPSHMSEEVQLSHHGLQHPASSFYFEDGDAVSHPPATRLPGRPTHQDLSPPPAPPEPGGPGANRPQSAQRLVSKRGVACYSTHDRPWRKRARDARRRTDSEDSEGFEAEVGGGGGRADCMRKRASEKEEVVASRKASQQKAMNRAALPIVDLVGIFSPLVIIAGMTTTIIQHVPWG